MPVSIELETLLRKDYRKDSAVVFSAIILILIPCLFFSILYYFKGHDDAFFAYSQLTYSLMMLYVPVSFFALPLALVIFSFRGIAMRMATDLKYLDKFLADDPDFVVWIVPVETKTTVAHVVTIDRAYSFMLRGKRGYRLQVNVNKQNGDRILREIINRYPNAHYGYSPTVHKLYFRKANVFLDELKKLNLYTPAHRFLK